MTDTSNKLLTRFRRQFFFANMAFALAVLLLVFAAVLGISWKQHVDDVYDALDARINMTGKFGGVPGADLGFGAFDPHILGGVMQDDAGASASASTSASASQANTLSQDLGTTAASEGSSQSSQDSATSSQPAVTDGESAMGQNSPLQDGRGPGGRTEPREMSNDQFVATALYFVKADGTVLSGHNEAFSIDDDLLAEGLDIALAEEASGPSGSSGHISQLNLYYKVRYTHDDNYVVAFASGKYIDQNMANLAFMLLLAGLGALLAFALVSLLLSRWITRPVENAWNQQQQFIADASHELKTPLTVITANDSILLSQPDATIESQRQWIESTETEAHLMQDLVNDMLYLAKSDAAKQPLEYGQADMSELATMQVLQFESVAFEKGVAIASDVQKEVKLDGDPSRLQRLVAILLDNACKYVDQDGHIDLTLRKTDKVCILQVRNSGPVVDPADIPHLFDRFYRSDKARTRGTGGFGLGLSIAKSIVEDHKGSIRVASSAEKGTTFTVELPLTR